MFIQEACSSLTETSSQRPYLDSQQVQQLGLFMTAKRKTQHSILYPHMVFVCVCVCTDTITLLGLSSPPMVNCVSCGFVSHGRNVS